jgi:hypothetical protein
LLSFFGLLLFANNTAQKTPAGWGKYSTTGLGMLDILPM